jgi:hypothetical protein
MWLTIVLILAVALALLGYLYGVFSTVSTYKDRLLSPHLIHFTFRGHKNQLS